MDKTTDNQEKVIEDSAWPGFIQIEMPEITELIGKEAYDSQVQLMKDMDPTGRNRRRIGRIGLNS